MMKAAQLRQAILQAAVQGKLVPQNPHDEPASVLLERIRAAKSKLIKEGKLKKEKHLLPVSDEETLYNLPQGWELCRLSDVGDIVGGATPDTAQSQFYTMRGNGISWLTPADMKNAKHDIISSGNKDITQAGYDSCSTKLIPSGSIVFSSRAPIGLIAFAGAELCTNQGFKSVVPYDMNMKSWIFYYLNQHTDIIIAKASGTTFKEVSGEFMRKEVIPIPPLVEQERIVSRLKELMALCDELETAEKTSEALDKHFMEYLPKSILQAAVHGKLVPQNPSDEPASVLLERIRAEKMKLVKAGKLKKEKPLPPITEDEILYDLPDGWEWCRLGEIHTIHRGITFPASAKGDVHTKGVVCCATTGSVQETYNPTADVYVPEKYVKNRDQWLLDNDIIMSTANSRELVGKTCFWNGGERKTFGGFLTVIRACGCLSVKYSYYVLQYLWKTGAFVTTSTQTTNIANINNSVLANTIIPIPPLAEQERIVAKVDELMALCAKLKTAAEDVEILETKQATIIPLGRPQENESLRMAARGKVNKEVSEAHRKAREDMFNDD